MKKMEADQNKNNYDLQLKIIIVGDSSVGKSSILNYYLKNTCRWFKLMFNLYYKIVNHNIKHTVGVEFG